MCTCSKMNSCPQHSIACCPCVSTCSICTLSCSPLVVLQIRLEDRLCFQGQKPAHISMKGVMSCRSYQPFISHDTYSTQELNCLANLEYCIQAAEEEEAEAAEILLMHQQGLGSKRKSRGGFQPWQASPAPNSRQHQQAGVRFQEPESSDLRLQPKVGISSCGVL